MAIPAGGTSTSTTGTSLDLLTLAEGHQAINEASTTGTDTRLAQLITATSRRVDSYVGPVVIRTIADEAHDGGDTTIRLAPDDCDLHLAPVTITSVVEYNGTTPTTLTAETISSQTADQYVWDRRAGVLRRRSSGTSYLFPSGFENVIVTYDAGRYSATETVDEPFKEAARIMLRNLWSGRATGGGTDDMFSGDTGARPYPFVTFAIPNAVKDLIGHLHVPSVA